MDKHTQRIIQNSKDNIDTLLCNLEEKLHFLNDLIDFITDKQLFSEFLLWRVKREQ